MLRKLAIFFLAGWTMWAEKRPLTHGDYDAWRHIQNQQLSNDGKFLAYAVFPQAGDGEVVIRNLATGIEMHEAAGELPPTPPPNYANPQQEETPPGPPAVNIKFSPDGGTAVFLAFASHDEVEKAKRAKKKPTDTPKGDLVMVDLKSGQASRVPHAISFQLASKAGAALAYLQQADVSAAKAEPNPDAKAEGDVSTAGGEKKPVKGTLFLRPQLGGAERKFSNVTEYTLLKDGSSLVFADDGGVRELAVGASGEPARLLSGPGTYTKLSWDEEERRLAFLADQGDPSSKRKHFRVFTWDRHAAAASELASSASAGFPAQWIVSDKAPVTLSKGGRFVFFGTTPEPAPAEAADQTPADEKVSVDLWAWNDDYIQPMQKVRATTERQRSYRAVVDAKSKKFVQLGDPTLTEVLPAEDGQYAVGNDDREYRRMQEYDERYEDTYLVNTETGKRTLVAKKHLGRISWSPDSRHAIYFDGKDWILISAPQAGTQNLTKGTGISFGREPYDMPSDPPAEGPALWAKDGRSVIFYDHFDVWRYTLGAAKPVNWTAGFGRTNQLQLRVVRPERGEAEDRYLDESKPVILRAENDDTRDTGFYRLEKNRAPTRLTMAAKNFAPPIKARDADVYVTAESTFSEYPDLEVTNGEFRQFKKVSQVGDEVNNFTWGTAELMHFESADGVKLEGTLYKPANFDPQHKYPMIVYIYERLSQNVNNFVEPRPTNAISPSYYTSNGYVVLEPDIAYKTGYPGQSALRCVLPAVQSIVNRGYVDEKAIGIQGHSWGGYQIAYMVTQTDRFKAAAPGAPVADMISAYDGIRWGPGLPRQFQYERTQSRIGGTPWEFPLRYIENSPIFMVDRINTPLLMIHNDADDAVPWYQGIEYFLALRRLNKEVYMFSYNGEPHNLRRRPNQKDYTMRLQQFFDYYLKGAEEPDWMKHGIPYIHKLGGQVSADYDPQ